MPEYLKTCALCKSKEKKPWPKGMKMTDNVPVESFPSHNIVCIEERSPMYGKCVIGCWGCIYSTALSPDLLMANGDSLADYQCYEADL